MVTRSLPSGLDAGKRRATVLRQAAYFIVLIIACAIYLPSLMGTAIWDDHILLSGDAIGGGHSLKRCFTSPFLNHYFRPLVSVSFYLDRKLWGEGPFFFHQTNILLHLLATALLMNLLRAAFSSRRVALAGGLLFAVQPVQVSTVAWIGGRTDSFCTFWVTLFGWTLIRAAQSVGRQRAAWLAASTLAFGAVLLTKEQALLLLPLVPLAFRCFAPERKSRWELGLPFLAVSVAFIALWLLNYPEPFKPAWHRIGHQLCLGGWTITYYTLLMLLPTPQWMHTLSLGALERTGLWTALCGYGVALWCVVLFARWLRVAPARAWLLALTILNLLPVSNLVPVPSLLVAPYRAGVAGLGVAGLLGAAVVAPTLSWRRERAGAGSGRRDRRPIWSLAVGAALIAWCSVLTAWGAQQWEDESHLFATIVRYDPDSIIARYNLATTLLHSYRTAPARAQLEEVLQRLFGSSAWKETATAMEALHRDPQIMARVRENQGNRVHSIQWLGMLYAQLGAAHLQQQDLQGALIALHTGEQLDPHGAEVNLGLGCCAHLMDDNRRAARYFKIANAADPKQAPGHATLGQIYASWGRWPAAYQEFRTWVRLQPWLGAAYTSLADAQAHLGDRAGAKATLECALRRAICNRDDMRERIARLEAVTAPLSQPTPPRRRKMGAVRTAT